MYEDHQFAEEITNYFDLIFTSQNASAPDVVSRALTPRISEATNRRLTSIPTATKIRNALFSIHPDKAPGADGFSACFFQANWTTIGDAIVKEV